jgi:hypothetical protein
MAIFTPPTDNFVRSTLVENFTKGIVLSKEQRLANRLAAHVRPTARGRNVYLLTNGTYTENEPSDMTTVTKVYYGGHNIEVDGSEVASLTAAGYGEYISG